MRENDLQGMKVKVPKEAALPQRKHRGANEAWLREEGPRWDRLLEEARLTATSDGYYITFSRKWENYKEKRIDSNQEKGKGGL